MRVSGDVRRASPGVAPTRRGAGARLGEARSPAALGDVAHEDGAGAAGLCRRRGEPVETPRPGAARVRVPKAGEPAGTRVPGGQCPGLSPGEGALPGNAGQPPAGRSATGAGVGRHLLGHHAPGAAGHGEPGEGGAAGPRGARSPGEPGPRALVPGDRLPPLEDPARAAARPHPRVLRPGAVGAPGLPRPLRLDQPHLGRARPGRAAGDGRPSPAGGGPPAGGGGRGGRVPGERLHPAPGHGPPLADPVPGGSAYPGPGRRAGRARPGRAAAGAPERAPGGCATPSRSPSLTDRWPGICWPTALRRMARRWTRRSRRWSGCGPGG